MKTCEMQQGTGHEEHQELQRDQGQGFRDKEAAIESRPSNPFMLKDASVNGPDDARPARKVQDKVTPSFCLPQGTPWPRPPSWRSPDAR